MPRQSPPILNDKLSPLVILYVVAVALPVRFSIGSVQMTGLRTYLALVFIPVLISYCRNRPHKGLSTDLLFILFALWSLVAFAQTSPAHVFENTGALVLELIGGFMISRRFVRTADEFRATIKVIFISVLLSFPLAIAESVTGYPPIIMLVDSIPGLTSVEPISIEPRLGLERAQVMFAHPIHYGLFTSTLTALAFVGMRGSWSLWTRTLGLGISIFASFLALSSGAFLSVVLQMSLIGWALVFPRWRKRWLLLTALCVVTYFAVDLISNRTPMRVFFSYATFSAHNAYWRGIIFEWGILNVLQNPLFGIGLNDWVRPDFMRSDSMDNFWLVIAVRYGLPGFVLFASAYIIGIIRVAYAALPPELHSIRRAWVICFVGLTFTLCTVHIWTSIYSFVFFLFGSGLWMLNPSTTSQKARPKRGTPIFTRFTSAPV